MKKLLMVLGAVFAVLIVVIAIIAVKGVALDREAGAYADDSIKAIATTWDEQALVQRASPEFFSVTQESALDGIFAQFRQLGRMTHYGGSTSNSNVMFSPKGKEVTAACLAKAQFEHGDAEIRLLLIKHNGAWQIMGFRVFPKSVPPSRPTIG
jgi:hypothetical protein